MTKVRMMKSIGIFLILVFATNAAFAFTARHTLANLAKINHSGKKKTSNLISDYPDPDSDFKIASRSIHHLVKKTAKFNQRHAECLSDTYFHELYQYHSHKHISIVFKQPFGYLHSSQSHSVAICPIIPRSDCAGLALDAEKFGHKTAETT